jgi:hypothetical protein
MLVLFPLIVGKAGLNAAAPLYFLRLKIKGGGALFDLAQPIGLSGIEKDHFGYGSLPGSAVANQGIGPLSG